MPLGSLPHLSYCDTTGHCNQKHNISTIQPHFKSKPHLVLATEPLQCQDGGSQVSLQPSLVATHHHTTQLLEVQVQIRICYFSSRQQQGNAILPVVAKGLSWASSTSRGCESTWICFFKKIGRTNFVDDQFKIVFCMSLNASIYIYSRIVLLHTAHILNPQCPLTVDEHSTVPSERRCQQQWVDCPC